MQSLIEKILAFLPQYLMDFGAVFVGPKKFAATKNGNIKDNYQPALMFGAISMVLVVILTLPLLPPGKDLWTYLAALCVVELISVALSAAALRFAWHAVGGKAVFGSFFITLAYFFGVVLVLISINNLLSAGFFRALQPDSYAQIQAAVAKGTRWPDLSHNRFYMAASIIHAVGFVLICIWGFLGWGAYRVLNNLSKTRSACAIVIWWVCAAGITAVVYCLGTAMRS